MDDIENVVRDARPEAAPYDGHARSAARARLLQAGTVRHGGVRPTRTRRTRFVIAVGALAVAATAVVVVGRLDGAPPAVDHGPAVVALPVIAPVSATEVLGRAASAAKGSGEADPRDDQFVKVESQTMYQWSSPEARYLYRTRRTIWQSADGRHAGALKIEHLAPRPYPGRPLPEQATRDTGETSWNLLPACDLGPEDNWFTYASLKKLPADAAGMHDYLYGRAGEKAKLASGKNSSVDDIAWTMLGDMLRETAIPAAQRAALFEAAKSIPGTTVTEDATDAADRSGIGVGRVLDGVRNDLIFQPDTYAYLGERGVVVDADEAKAPVGSLVASTAQLSVSVADKAPDVDDPASTCAPPGNS
ncbi:CU044_5270 family protein [Nonomuraea maritima]|uniref:CU044_5270 family protein n=1 Tax=Nonomuraea maritima TaxID=683260 RepID=UPI0037214834